jgi:hypothetical protein
MREIAAGILIGGSAIAFLIWLTGTGPPIMWPF